MNDNSHTGRARSARRRSIIALAVVLVLLAIVPIASGGSAYDADRVLSLPTVGAVSNQFAGYASASPTPCADLRCTDRAGLFYWMFGRSASYATQPTIVWSNGGPGVSSFYGPLSENGPYDVVGPGRLVPNPNSWTKAANYLFFDHPLGVGLSFPFHGQFAHSMPQGIDELYNALVHVVARRGLQRSPLFLTGESLGSSYMPLLAQRVLDGQRSTHIRLGGVIIAAGFVDPLVQVSTTADYAYAHGLIDARQKAILDRVLARCRRLMRGPPPSSPAATKTCYSIQSKIADMSGRISPTSGRPATSITTPCSTTSTGPTFVRRCTRRAASSRSTRTRSARHTSAVGWTRIGASWRSSSTGGCR